MNRQLTEGRRPERVDQRSLVAQREEALQKGHAEKATALDQELQVKLGWKVVQMELRGVSSDRGGQLRQVQVDNTQRQSAVLDIGQLRVQFTKRQEEEAVRKHEAEQKKQIAEVEAVFRGQGPLHREATLKRWRYLAGKEVPYVANARAYWEQDQWDPDAKAWRETLKTIEWEIGQGARGAAAIEEWRQKHPVQALALRAGLKKPPVDLRRLEQTHGESIPFLQGSQRRLAELEQAWPKKRLAYQQQLEREGEEIRKAKRCLGVIEGNSEHFQKFWTEEHQKQRQREDGRYTRDRDHGRRTL